MNVLDLLLRAHVGTCTQIASHSRVLECTNLTLDRMLFRSIYLARWPLRPLKRIRVLQKCSAGNPFDIAIWLALLQLSTLYELLRLTHYINFGMPVSPKSQPGSPESRSRPAPQVAVQEEDGASGFPRAVADLAGFNWPGA